MGAGELIYFRKSWRNELSKPEASGRTDYAFYSILKLLNIIVSFYAIDYPGLPWIVD